MYEIAVESPLHQYAAERDAPVECPKCGRPARKAEYPNARLPVLPEARANLAPFLGRAYCENVDCHVHKSGDLISWTYGYGAT